MLLLDGNIFRSRIFVGNQNTALAAVFSSLRLAQGPSFDFPPPCKPVVVIAELRPHERHNLITMPSKGHTSGIAIPVRPQQNQNFASGGNGENANNASVCSDQCMDLMVFSGREVTYTAQERYLPDLAVWTISAVNILSDASNP